MTTHRNKWDGPVFAGILFLLIFTPLAFGSVHVWAYSLMEFGVAVLLSVYVMSRVLSADSTPEWVRTSFNPLLLLFLLVIGIQMIPIPASWVAFVSPRTFSDKTQLFESQKISIAYSFHPAMTEWLKLGSYLGMFFLVLNIVRSKRRMDILICVLVFAGLFESLYAIFQTFSETPMIWWWVSRVGGAKFASGTFIGSNHFALYLEMILPLTLGFMIAQRDRGKRLVPVTGSTLTFARKIVICFSPESANFKKILLFSIAIVIGTALLLSASRGGILSMSAAMFFMASLFSSRKEHRKYGKLALGLCLIAVVHGFWLGITPTLGKFESIEKGAEGRLHTSLSLMPMIGDYPVFGVGYGNFRYVYPRYAPDKTFDAIAESGYAHNDWLEAGTETGLIGLTLLVSAFSVCLFKMIRTWKLRRDLHAVGIGAGAMTGLMSVAFHSLSDFGMHIPANPLTLAALLALGYAALHRQGHGYGESFFYRTERFRLTPLRQFVLGCVAIVLFSGSTFFIFRHFWAEISCPSEWNSTMNLNRNPYLTDIRKAISVNPDNAEYHFEFAAYHIGIRGGDETLRREFAEKAIESLETAIRLNPAMGKYWYSLGKSYSLRRHDADEYADKWLSSADRCFDMAVRFAPKDEFILINAAGYWVWRSKQPGEKDKIEKFRNLFRMALEINPNQWEASVSRVWEYYPDDAMVVADIAPPGNEELKARISQWVAKKAEFLPVVHTQTTSP